MLVVRVQANSYLPLIHHFGWMKSVMLELHS